MGLKIRGLFRQSNSWTDTACIKHKHCYTQPCNLRITCMGVEKNYKAKKCEFCLSFVNATRTTILDLDYPVVEFEKNDGSARFKNLQYITTW